MNKFEVRYILKGQRKYRLIHVQDSPMDIMEMRLLRDGLARETGWTPMDVQVICVEVNTNSVTRFTSCYTTQQLVNYPDLYEQETKRMKACGYGVATYEEFRDKFPSLAIC